MSAATFGCMYTPFGCMSMERLGAKCAVVGCKVCGCWVPVYGDFCHIQEDLVRFMSCGVMQQQKHPLVVLPNVQFAD